MLITPPPEFRKRRRRLPERKDAPSLVSVIAVARLNANLTIWAFSSPVLELSDVSGLKVNGNVPGGTQETSPQVIVEYDESVSVGDPWTADPAGFIGTFAGGGTLAPAAGTVVAALNVFEVSTDDPPQPGRAIWIFDGPATLAGTPVGLRVQVGGEWINPVEAIQSGPSEIVAVYDTAEMLNGKSYSIVAPPGGLVQAAAIVLPQDGTIVVP